MQAKMVKLTMLAAPLTMMLWRQVEGDVTPNQTRVAFGVVVLASVAMLLYIWQLIHQRQDRTSIEVEVKQPGRDATKENKPVYLYDEAELKKLITKMLIPLVIVTGLHYYKGFLQPLAIQAVMLPLTLSESPLFKIYFLNRLATGPLARPFKEESPFAAFTEAKDKAKEAAASKKNEGPAGSNGDQAPIANEGSSGASAAGLTQRKVK